MKLAFFNSCFVVFNPSMHHAWHFMPIPCQRTRKQAKTKIDGTCSTWHFFHLFRNMCFTTPQPYSEHPSLMKRLQSLCEWVSLHMLGGTSCPCRCGHRREGGICGTEKF